MADLNVFPLTDIVSFIRDRDWEGCIDFAIEDIKNGNANKIRQVYYNFLMEFGFSKDILLPQFDFLDDGDEYQEMYRDITPLLVMSASLDWLLGKLSPEDKLRFGLRDLTHPAPKRAQRFLTILQNFWLFYSQIYEDLKKRETEVQDMVNRRTQLLSTLERYKEEYNQLIVQEVEDKASVDSLQHSLVELGAHLDQLSGQVPELKNRITALKETVEQLERDKTEILERQRQIEREKLLLQGSEEKCDSILRLEQELEELARKQTALEVRSFQLSNNAEKCEQFRQEYAALLDQSRAAQEDGVRMRQLQQKNRELDQELERVRLQDEELDTVSRDKEDQIQEAESSISVARLKWNRRKAAKEEEARELKQVVETARCQLSQEQQQVAALAAQGAQLEASKQELHHAIQMDEDQMKQEYSDILEEIETFNGQLTADYARMEEIKRRIVSANSKNM